MSSARAARSSPGLLLLLLVAACGGAAGSVRSRPPAEGEGEGKVERGLATFYSARFHGRLTASGERFDRNAMTAAHRTHRFGTRVRVTNLKNGKAVVVRINDRGPYAQGRVIDVSPAAAEELDMMRAGVVPVTVEVVSRP